MSLADNLRNYVKSLLGVSAFQPVGDGYGPHVEDAQVDAVREAFGGNIQPLPTTRLRWYLADLEHAQTQADAGYLRMAAQIYRAMRRDGTLAGLLATRTAGLVRLDKRYYGNEEIISALRERNGSRSIFDEMFPPSELGLLAGDGIVLGIGVAEMVPVEGRSYPVMVRLEPEFLQYRWSENRWYFNSIAGMLPIVPGDGRWILHMPGGRLTPWTSGLWPALGRSFINKEHALLHRSNYSAKLANPARVAVSPLGANEVERKNFFQRLMQWGTNTVFSLPVGWDVKLIESNGRGFEVFEREIATSDLEYMIALLGQVVTQTGGTGFSNQDVPESILRSRIQDTGDALAYTINTQGIPQFAVSHFGIDSLQNPALVEWETMTPVDRAKEASTFVQVAAAIKGLNEALAPLGRRLDDSEITVRFGIPTFPVTAHGKEESIEIASEQVENKSQAETSGPTD